MGYRIEYGKEAHCKRTKLRNDRHRMNGKIGAVLVTVSLAILILSMSGVQKIRGIRGTGEVDVLATALECLVTELEEGSSIRDAFAAFCIEVLADGT